MRIISGYKNTRTNNEDFAITPYLFSVFFSSERATVYGIGICWGHQSVFISIGYGLPKSFPSFRIFK